MVVSLKKHWDTIGADASAMRSGLKPVPGGDALDRALSELLTSGVEYEAYAGAANAPGATPTACKSASLALANLIPRIRRQIDSLKSPIDDLVKKNQDYQKMGQLNTERAVDGAQGAKNVTTLEKLRNDLSSLDVDLFMALQGVGLTVDPLPGTQSPYDKVQFLCISMMTGPGPDKTDPSKKIYYGDGNITNDIQARLTIVKTIMDAAYAKGSTQSKVLKVLIFPEFLLRGPFGAYTFDQAATAVNGLQALAADKKWADWLFVFGTIVASAQAKAGTGDPTHEAAPGQLVGNTKEVVTNFSLIQKGGFGMMLLAPDAAKVVEKLAISGIDFLKSSELASNNLLVLELTSNDVIAPYIKGTGGGPIQAYDINTKVLENDPNPAYGGAVFTRDGIKMSLEVCLDFVSQRMAKNLWTSTPRDIKAQMVASCGVPTWENKTYFQARCVAVTNGWMAGCDGLNYCQPWVFKVTNGQPQGNSTLDGPLTPASVTVLDALQVAGTNPAQTLTQYAQNYYAPRTHQLQAPLAALTVANKEFYLADYGALALP